MSADFGAVNALAEKMGRNPAARAVADRLAELRLEFALDVAGGARGGTPCAWGTPGALSADLKRALYSGGYIQKTFLLARALADAAAGGRFAREAVRLLDTQAERSRREKDLIEGTEVNSCPDCGLGTVVDPDRSEAVCPGCRRVFGLYGAVFEDSQFYAQDGQKAKSGCFNPNRHYAFWMDRILALEPDTELGSRGDPDNTRGEKTLAALRARLHRQGRILQMITVEDVRGMLRELKLTSLNQNVSLVIKKLTGRGPPPLSEAKRTRGEALFSKAIEIREQICRARANRNYYPYYIYKIYDAILEKDDPDRAMLRFIHLQGEETLSSNDLEWRDICNRLPEITWRPTLPHQTQRRKF